MHPTLPNLRVPRIDKQAEGKIKNDGGKLVGNETLEAKGKIQRVLGKAQAKYGDVKQDVGMRESRAKASRRTGSTAASQAEAMLCR